MAPCWGLYGNRRTVLIPQVIHLKLSPSLVFAFWYFSKQDNWMQILVIVVRVLEEKKQVRGFRVRGGSGLPHYYSISPYAGHCNARFSS